MLARLARWYLVKSAVREAALRDLSKDAAKRIAQKCLATLNDDVIAGASYHASEQEILSKRLGQRYDMGMAVNEAAKRALSEKAAVNEPVVRLSAAQEKALEFQKQYLQRIVDKA